MPLKIEVTTTEAKTSVTRFNRKLGDVLLSIGLIKKAFKNLNLDQLNKAKEDVASSLSWYLKANQLKKSGYHIRIIKENGMYSIYKHKK